MAVTSGSQIEQLLGDEAEALLTYQAHGIDKGQLHLPGPDFIDRVWKDLGSKLPTECRRFVHGVACLVQDRTGVILAFGWGTAYALRLPPAELGEALAGGASAAMKWSGGSVTDLSIELGGDWLWGKYAANEPGWVAAAYAAF